MQPPDGGYFVWVHLPDIDTARLRTLCKAQFGAQFLPGAKCSVKESSAFASYMRLSFAFYEEDELEEGVKRIAQAVAVYRQGTPTNQGNEASVEGFF